MKNYDMKVRLDKVMKTENRRYTNYVVQQI